MLKNLTEAIKHYGPDNIQTWFSENNGELLFTLILLKFKKQYKEMKKEYIELLVCPETGENLKFVQKNNNKDNGYLVNESNTHEYQVVNSIPRFVPLSNYADNFGMQWNNFPKTQLDSYSGQSISSDRFWGSTNWPKESMKNKLVLDIGCGSGRFSEIALSSGAIVVGIDYSNAVDACWNNLKSNPNFFVIQADIYNLPFSENSFDYIYSLGVLQHTPDVKKAFDALPKLLKNNGEICVDFYEKSFKSSLLPKYWLRPFTKNIDNKKLFKWLKLVVPYLLNLSIFLSYVPLLGKYLRRLVPVANYKGIHPLNKKQIKEWALLDTNDWLSTAYDNPQNSRTIYRWMEEAELKNIEVLKVSHLVGRGKRILS